MRRVAAIDVGTNSVLLLVAEATGGVPRAVHQRATITRLGAGVDRTGYLSEAACRRTLACLRDYAADLDRFGVERVVVLGTSALRDARNAETFRREARDLLGVQLCVVDGEEEARLAFRGALTGLSVRGSVSMVDIGGGSTEIATGTVDDTGPLLAGCMSLQIGCVRLFERLGPDDPPEPSQVRALRDAVRSTLAACGPPTAQATLVGVAGTLTTLAAISLGLTRYDGARVHGARLSRVQVGSLAAQLGAMPVAARRNVVGLDPERADVIVAGAWIAAEVLTWSCRDEILVSDRGLRWGVVADLLSG